MADSAEMDDMTEPLQLSYYCMMAKDKAPLQVKTLLELTAQELMTVTETKKRLPFRFVAVIDESGSMQSTINGETLIDKMKVFAEVLVKCFQEEDMLGIVGFTHYTRIILPMTKMDKDGKANAIKRIESICADGGTNLSAGIISGVELFSGFNQESCFRNGIIVFTDGETNNGICDADGIVDAFNTAKEAAFSSSACLPISTFTIGGYRPDLLYQISQRLGSDAFFWINDFDNFETDMMIPVYLRETSLVSDILVNLRAINGVTFDIEQMKSDRMVSAPEDAENCVSTAYYFHDISADMFKHIPCYLNIPNDYEDALENKGIMEVHITYRDFNNAEREIRAVIPFKLTTLGDLKKDKWRKENKTEETRDMKTAGDKNETTTVGDKNEESELIGAKKKTFTEGGTTVEGDTFHTTKKVPTLSDESEVTPVDISIDEKSIKEAQTNEDTGKKTVVTGENQQSPTGHESDLEIKEVVRTSETTQEINEISAEKRKEGGEHQHHLERGELGGNDDESTRQESMNHNSVEAQRDQENMSINVNATHSNSEGVVTRNRTVDEYIPTEMELQTIVYMSLNVASELDEVTRAEQTIAKIAQEECRTMAVGGINTSANFFGEEYVDLVGSKRTITETRNNISHTKTHVNTILSEETGVIVSEYANSMIGHLDVCSELLENHYDIPTAWQKMKAMASSIANESPTSGRIFRGEDRPFAPPAMKTEMQKYKKIVTDTKAEKKKEAQPARPQTASAPAATKKKLPARPKTANSPKSPETVRKLFKDARKGTKAVVTTRTFKNRYFTLSDKLVAGRAGKKSLESVKELIIKHGGTPVPFVQNSVLVCTKEEFEKKTAKVRDAKANKTPIVFEEFIYDSIKAKKMLDIEDYRFW